MICYHTQSINIVATLILYHVLCYNGRSKKVTSIDYTSVYWILFFVHALCMLGFNLEVFH